MEAVPPEMPDKTDLEMTELMENPTDAYQAQLMAEKAKKIQNAEQLLKNAQGDGKVKNKFSKPGRGGGEERVVGEAVLLTVLWLIPNLLNLRVGAMGMMESLNQLGKVLTLVNLLAGAMGMIQPLNQ